jgi:hypothetical protein
MKVSIAIMAHPKRKRFLPVLLERLPGAVVVWDQGNNRWDTGRRSMLAFDPEADWHLVVQDDSLLCRGFLAQVHGALAEVEDGPVAFYCGRNGRFGSRRSSDVMRAAFQSGEHWIKEPGPYWGPAVAVRTQDIPAMIEWCDPRDDVPYYDLRMARYFDSIGRLCWYSVPSLVDHRTGADNPSLVKGRGNSMGRTAAIWSPNGRREWCRERLVTDGVEAPQLPGQTNDKRRPYVPLGRHVPHRKRR